MIIIIMLRDGYMNVKEGAADLMIIFYRKDVSKIEFDSGKEGICVDHSARLVFCHVMSLVIFISFFSILFVYILQSLFPSVLNPVIFEFSHNVTSLYHFPSRLNFVGRHVNSAGFLCWRSQTRIFLDGKQGSTCLSISTSSSHELIDTDMYIPFKYSFSPPNPYESFAIYFCKSFLGRDLFSFSSRLWMWNEREKRRKT